MMPRMTIERPSAGGRFLSGLHQHDPAVRRELEIDRLPGLMFSRSRTGFGMVTWPLLVTVVLMVLPRNLRYYIGRSGAIVNIVSRRAKPLPHPARRL